jgi:hypothetical protein
MTDKTRPPPAPPEQLDLLQEWDERLGRKLRRQMGFNDTGAQ